VATVRRELDARAEKGILEARESGTVGIYDRTGAPLAALIHEVASRIGVEWLVFEAPRREQQLWMLRAFGQTVNLDNVPVDDAVALATLRAGLRRRLLRGRLSTHWRTGTCGSTSSTRRAREASSVVEMAKT
jgi:phosphosulfolactate synthase (CoM biosynthesis protein A)